MEDKEALDQQVQRMRTTVALLRQTLQLETAPASQETLAKYLLPCQQSTGSGEETTENCALQCSRPQYWQEAEGKSGEGFLTERNRALLRSGGEFGQSSQQLLETQLCLLNKSYRKRIQESTRLQTKLSIMEIERGKGLQAQQRLEERIKTLESLVAAQSSEISSLHTALSRAETRLQDVETLEEDLAQLSQERELLLQTFQQYPQLGAGPEGAQERRRYVDFYEKVRALACEHSLAPDLDLAQVRSWVTHLAADYVQLKATRHEANALVQETRLASTQEALQLRNALPTDTGKYPTA